NEKDIEIYSDDEDVEFDVGSSRSITYVSSSSFFRTINSKVGRDFGHTTTSVIDISDNDLIVGMQFEFKQTIIVNDIKEFHFKNSFDYVVVESMLDRYVGRRKHFGWDTWEIKKISGTHSCVSTLVSQVHIKLNSSFISDLFINLVFVYPSLPVKALVKEIASRFGYTYFSPDTVVKYQTRHYFVNGVEDPSRLILDRGFWNIANSKFTRWKQACISSCLCSYRNREERNLGVGYKFVSNTPKQTD
ncbi:hypothetical protein Lal_00024213, partial [Lupinus albus]